MKYRHLIENYVDSLSDQIMDMLTPLASNGVEYLTIDQVIDSIKSLSTGFHIDRSFVMDVLNPNKFPLVKAIEGDKVYLQHPQVQTRSVSDEQKQKEQSKIEQIAQKQAIKNIRSS